MISILQNAFNISIKDEIALVRTCTGISAYAFFLFQQDTFYHLKVCCRTMQNMFFRDFNYKIFSSFQEENNISKDPLIFIMFHSNFKRN